MRTNIAAKEHGRTARKGDLKTLFTAVLAAMLTSVVLLLVFAYFITYRDLPESAPDVAVMLCAFLSAGAGGIVGGRLIGSRGLLNGLLIGFLYFLALYVLGFLASMEMNLSSPILYELLFSAAGGMAGGLIGVNTRGRSRR